MRREQAETENGEMANLVQKRGKREREKKRGEEERELGFKIGYRGVGERAMRTAENRGTWHMVLVALALALA